MLLLRMRRRARSWRSEESWSARLGKQSVKLDGTRDMIYDCTFVCMMAIV